MESMSFNSNTSLIAIPLCVCVQGFVELAALEEILDPYLTSQSRENFELSKKHLGSWDIQGNERWVVYRELCGSLRPTYTLLASVVQM